LFSELSRWWSNALRSAGNRMTTRAALHGDRLARGRHDQPRDQNQRCCELSGVRARHGEEESGEVLRQMAGPGIPTIPTELIGRNRNWGTHYSARFRMGTEAALRTTLLRVV